MIRRRVMRALPLVTCLTLGLFTAACNTTKATIDSMVRFTMSTSPESIFNADGLVKEEYKVPLYTAVTYENIEVDAARGSGEYVASLGTLQGVTEPRQSEFAHRLQTHYGDLFAGDRFTSRKALEAQTRAYAVELVR